MCKREGSFKTNKQTNEQTKKALRQDVVVTVQKLVHLRRDLLKIPSLGMHIVACVTSLYFSL